MMQEANSVARDTHEPGARYPSLVDRVVLITGGATGIGAAFVEHFVAQGARVGFLDIDASAGVALADALAGQGQSEDQSRDQSQNRAARHKPHFVTCDLTDIGALRHAVASMKAALGPIQVLVNNAANDRREALADITPRSFDDGIAVNVRHQLFAAQAVVEDMKAARAGAIINLGSISWMLKNSEFPVYAMSKSAVQGLTRGLAKELGPYGIRVNTLVPGWVMTDKQRRLWLTDEGRELIRRGQCIDAELLPADLARAALFLAADDSRMITAQDIVVDGGWV
ncbi:MAG: SDR family oxidoreductase [Paraburkholderia sp.]|uniref:SDR family NAD(P)-dependent oxidoreductase n=1 Tax=Paraburkholderia sp. TaxID=1926495 RepID=UPI00122784C8|nr:SDR family oxidoreductase [Paraburkholderia sp.]TAM00089.1 MAG: SDR family oxidoreductase [Paraburkholderia sp.]TAM27696.1 MAG: SDR family oxidoreductase [Paraburkholderia sp.]